MISKRWEDDQEIERWQRGGKVERAGKMTKRWEENLEEDDQELRRWSIGRKMAKRRETIKRWQDGKSWEVDKEVGNKTKRKMTKSWEDDQEVERKPRGGRRSRGGKMARAGKLTKWWEENQEDDDQELRRWSRGRKMAKTRETIKR
jgi:hypothetical protein